MGMVVRTNTMSANAYRQLGMNNNAVTKSLEKLSSGYRINRAGDDASGLAISEKMNAQIKGLEQASSNSQDGISLVQTAEGALTEVHSMLNRMVELATKSANGTIQNDVDRDAIQTEVDALGTEVTRIAKSTNFNGITLLDGTMGASGAATITTMAGTSAPAGTTYSRGYSFIPSTSDADEGNMIGIIYTDESAASHTIYLTMKSSPNYANNEVLLGSFRSGYTLSTLMSEFGQSTSADMTNFNSVFSVGEEGGNLVFHARTDDPDISFTVISQSTAIGAAKFTSISEIPASAPSGTATGAKTELDFGTKTGKDIIGNTMGIGGKTYEFVKTGDTVKTAGNVAVNLDESDSSTNIASALTTAVKTDTAFYDASAAGKYDVISSGGKVTITSNTTGAASVAAAVTQNGGEGEGLTLQVGTTDDDYNKVAVKIGDMSSKGLGVDGLDISTQDAAGKAIDTVKTAINTVSTNRGMLGALQNRLEHAISNLDTTAENMTSANSRIRDTDMAKEMMNYTKMNILTQAAQSMLAQANQNPQSILQLLQ